MIEQVHSSTTGNDSEPGSIDAIDSRVVIVMGVSGSGKSTIARAVAEALALRFLEGDTFHPPANVKKMSTGMALTDEDRWPWLDALGSAIVGGNAKRGVVAACSALKRSYRDRLRRAIGPRLIFLYLSAERVVLMNRLVTRSGHYMPPALLDSQLETLEVPRADEADVIQVPSTGIEGTLDAVLNALR